MFFSNISLSWISNNSYMYIRYGFVCEVIEICIDQRHAVLFVA